MGYHRAGFEVVGVDIKPQKRYPFEFHEADAMTFPLDGFDLIHASPPCQRFSKMTKHSGKHEQHEDLVDDTRVRLIESETPYVIENVMGAPLLDPIKLCGSHFGLMVRRHRLFELSGFRVSQPACDHKSQGRAVGVYGHAGGSSSRDGLEFGGLDLWSEAMGIDWMTTRELAQAIPPAYTEYIAQGFLGEVPGQCRLFDV